MGDVSPAEFTFPYDDGEFTGALAASVFTHIDFGATSNYLSESARVLAHGGGLLASFFPGDETGRMTNSNWNFVITADDMRRAIGRANLEVLLFDPAPESRGQNWFLVGKPGKG